MHIDSQDVWSLKEKNKQQPKWNYSIAQQTIEKTLKADQKKNRIAYEMNLFECVVYTRWI